MKKLKPCVNHNCPHLREAKCEFSLPYTISGCSKYYNKRPETAWEMFGRLHKKYGNDFLKEFHRYHSCLRVFISETPEQGAIKIMQDIEKELNE